MAYSTKVEPEKVRVERTINIPKGRIQIYGENSVWDVILPEELGKIIGILLSIED